MQLEAAAADSRADSRTTVARATVPVRIASPDPNIAWRIEPRGGISRTNDGGASWVLQLKPTGTDLLAGAAPSTQVAWIGGRRGTLWLTVDGARWQKLSSPGPQDIVAIVADDERQAVVLTADSKRYRTSDSGRTWAVID
jgi:photosystem II stability/assembly factor-like uncharacterized protein